ncbi:MAG: O-antigen ligase family protein [Candidatus Magasanikbacteria bacterium]
MQKKIELIIKILAGSILFIPLVVISDHFIFPFIVPKIILFRSLILLMTIGFIALLASNWKYYRCRLTPITLAVGLYLLSFGLSTFIGVDWYHSFWDNHERMLGLFTIVHYILYYVMLSSLLREWKDWKWFMRIFLLSGSAVMLVGAWQKFINPEFLLNQDSSRVSSTLGNPIYYSAYGMFLFFVSILLSIKEKGRNMWRVSYVFVGLLGLMAIFTGGTRGALLGVIAGLGVLFICYALALKEYPKVRKVFIGLIFSGLLVLISLFAFRQTTFVSHIPTVGKLVNSSITGGTANTRLMAWGIAADAWKERPIFGWGPNNYFYAFNKYYRTQFLSYGYGETWFDNAHNIVMNTLAVQGAFGVLVYFGLFGTAIFVIWKAKKKGNVDVHIASIGTAFLVAHLVSNVFVFENPTSYLYFFFFLAFFNSSSIDYGSTERGSKISVGGLVLGSAVMLLLLFATNVGPARANNVTLKAIRTIYSGQNPLIAYESLGGITSPHIDDIRNDFTRAVVQALSKQLNKADPEKITPIIETTFKELSKNRELHPMDIRVHIQQAQLLQMNAQVNNDSSKVLEAEKIIVEAIELSPKRQQLRFMLGTVKTQLRKIEEATLIYEEVLQTDPKIAESWKRLVNFYMTIGDKERTADAVLRAEEHGFSFADDPYVNTFIGGGMVTSTQ